MSIHLTGAPVCCHGIILRMQALRRSSILARFVLAWIVLAVGVATASPLVKPKGFALVCSSVGVLKLLPASDDPQASAGLLHAFDCALCLSAAAPLSAAPIVAAHQAPRAFGLAPAHVAHVVFRSAAPLSARGPPQGL